MGRIPHSPLRTTVQPNLQQSEVGAEAPGRRHLTIIPRPLVTFRSSLSCRSRWASSCTTFNPFVLQTPHFMIITCFTGPITGARRLVAPTREFSKMLSSPHATNTTTSI
eukprot:670035-Prorocentrum_minimum.AAC.1